MGSDLRRSIGVVVKGWPRLSETFIAQELRALERRGFSLVLFSLRHPTDTKVHPLNRDVTAPVCYLPEYLWREPGRIWRAWRAARRYPGYRDARQAWLRDFRRDPTPNRGRRFGQALVLAAEAPATIGHLYAHFLHTPASVARYAALLRGLSWSVSAHAKDIWTTPDWEKREKLRDAQWAVTCTRAGRDHLAALVDQSDKVALVYHGIDPMRFPPADHPTLSRADAPIQLLSVGRAVPKKGYGDLVTALALLPGDLNWHFTHIGDGPLLKTLQDQAERLGLSARIDWRGAQTEDVVRAAYRAADLFVLASRVTKNGDRDGIPNVLLEAMSQGCPVVATSAAAIPELIADNVTGRLVAPGDPRALADALARLMEDPALRHRLGAAGEARVRRDFPLERGIDAIAAYLARSTTQTPPELSTACALRSTHR